jgi:hypothetical protein
MNAISYLFELYIILFAPKLVSLHQKETKYYLDKVLLIEIFFEIAVQKNS